MRTETHLQTRTLTQTDTHCNTPTLTDTHTLTHTLTHTHLHWHTLTYTHTHRHTRTHTHTYTHWPRPPPHTLRHTHTLTPIHWDTHTHTYTHRSSRADAHPLTPPLPNTHTVTYTDKHISHTHAQRYSLGQRRAHTYTLIYTRVSKRTQVSVRRVMSGSKPGQVNPASRCTLWMTGKTRHVWSACDICLSVAVRTVI